VPALQGLTGKQIIVQGYTDNLPIEEPLARRFPTNWDLAAGRAVSVVKFLEERGIDPSELFNRLIRQVSPGCIERHFRGQG